MGSDSQPEGDETDTSGGETNETALLVEAGTFRLLWVQVFSELSGLSTILRNIDLKMTHLK